LVFGFWAALLACGPCGTEARAQLAITEVMSWASTQCTCCLTQGVRNADFWELTNFGAATNDLTGYRFVDRDASFPAAAWRIEPDGLKIAPNESIIFVRARQNIPDAAAFRQWWGESNLPANLQIICCYPTGYGFDERGDGARLFDPDGNEVDQVYFGETFPGSTFAYDTNSGAALQSTQGACGAFQAATCADVGSPGWASNGPVALHILHQPTNQTVDAGSDVTLSVRASGLPRPRYQWYFNGAAISNPNRPPFPTLVCFAGCGPAWTESPPPSDLTIANAQPNDSGNYFVEVFNGLEKLTSAVVRLTINTTPGPVRLECPPAPSCTPAGGELSPAGLSVTLGQTATFKVIARGYPPPTFQWSRNTDGAGFVEIPGATNPTLDISGAQPSDAGIYRLRTQNPEGVTNAFATLIVKENPRLKITEAMAEECFLEANDWWELTNTGNEPVNLCGYRWDDATGNIGGGPTITNAVIIQPGESVIFLEGRTPEFFTAWWGASNLPPGLQFVSYTANGLSFDSDEINIWNPTAMDDSDWIDQVNFATATAGASFWFDIEACPISGIASLTSIEGECGAIRSAQGCDIGSPGWTRWTPPRLTSIRRDGVEVKLEWKAQPGSTTMVEYTNHIVSSTAPAPWPSLGIFSFPGATGSTSDTNAAGDPQRFYRVKQIAPANCICPPASPP